MNCLYDAFLGLLKRHHKHSGLRSHVFHLFSDVLLCSNTSEPALNGEDINKESGKSSAALEFKDGSGILCLSIPPFTASDLNTWFLICGRRKSLFVSSDLPSDKDKWIAAIQTCINKNKCSVDADLLYVTKQVALVNALLFILEQREAQKTKVEKQIESLSRSFECVDDDVWVELSASSLSPTSEPPPLSVGVQSNVDVADPVPSNRKDELHKADAIFLFKEAGDIQQPSTVLSKDMPPRKDIEISKTDNRRASTGIISRKITDKLKDDSRETYEGDLKALAYNDGKFLSTSIEYEAKNTLVRTTDDSMKSKLSTVYIDPNKHSRRASTGSFPAVNENNELQGETSGFQREKSAMDIQVSWWKLIDIATQDVEATMWRTSFTSDDAQEETEHSETDHIITQGNALRHVADDNARCIVHNVISLFEQDDSTKSRDLVSKLLINETYHYSISSGWFFCPKDTIYSPFNIPERENAETPYKFIRPTILRMFLFHDILIIGSTHDISKSKLSLHFYCKVMDLRVEDYCNRGVSDYAILLSTDKKPEEGNSLMPVYFLNSIARKMSSREKVTDVVLYAPTRSLKLEWISLLTAAVNVIKSTKRRTYRSINENGCEKVVALPDKPKWVFSSNSN